MPAQSPIGNRTSTIAIVLARAGSKGLAGKNVAALAGRPLVEWTILHARAASCLDAIVLSTDGQAIAAVGRRCGVGVVTRPPELASDTASVAAAARHALIQVEQQRGEPFDAAVILYGNVPLRPPDLIDRAVAKLFDTGCDSVQSVCPVGKVHPYWMKTLGGEGVTGGDTGGDVLEHYQPNAIHRRQDLPPCYMLDGGIIAVTRASLLRVDDRDPHAFLGADRRAVVTKPGEVIDVDDATDLAIAKAMMRREATKRRSDEATEGNTCRQGAADRFSPSSGRHTIIIAELGVNHDGCVDRALALTRAAKDAGADAVKLQLFDPRLLLSREAVLAAYQRQSADDVFDMLAGLQLSVDDMLRVRELAHELGLAFIVTPFSIESLADMRRLAPDAVKIASPDAVNLPLIEVMLTLGKPMLISTGTCELEELDAAVGVLKGREAAEPGGIKAGEPESRKAGDSETAASASAPISGSAALRLSGSCLLHCVSAYPTPVDQADLPRIGRLRQRFGLPVGYSDHTTNLFSGMLAVASQGACVIEKHLTYDCAAAGPDHAASFDPAQFAEYVKLIRRAEAAQRDASQENRSLEAEVRRASRQSVCTVRDLPAGHVLTRSDLTVKRPGTGIPAARLSEIVGRSLTRGVEANTLLREADLQTETTAAPLHRRTA